MSNITAATSRARVFFERKLNDGTTEIDSTWPGYFLPRRSYPVAMVYEDASVTYLVEGVKLTTNQVHDAVDKIKEVFTRTAPLDISLVMPRSLVIVEFSGSLMGHLEKLEAFALAAKKVPGVKVVEMTGGLPEFNSLNTAVTYMAMADEAAAFDEAEKLLRESKDFDEVLVVTDGYFQHYRPSNPDLWHWAITPRGADWMNKSPNPMDTVFLDM